MKKLDRIDKELLMALQANSKVNVKELADQLNMTKTPIYERLKRFEKEQIIEKYVAILDSKKLGSFMEVFCFVSLEKQKLNEIEAFSKAIEDIPEVLECYLLGGANDFLLKVIVKDLDEYHQFSSGKLATIPNVAQIKSSFVLNNIKKSTVMPIH